MKLKLILSLVIVFNLQYSFAQKHTYADSLSKALNAIIAALPDKYTSLCGKVNAGSDGTSFGSLVSLPGSVHNRVDIDTSSFTNYPFVFMSYVPAGNDKNKAIAKLKNIGTAILATNILYNGKTYKIINIEGESKTGSNPDYQYKLQDAPAELTDVKLYIRLDDKFGVQTKYKYTMGVYIKKK